MIYDTKGRRVKVMVYPKDWIAPQPAPHEYGFMCRWKPRCRPATRAEAIAYAATHPDQQVEIPEGK